jgi:hypothetical protein
MKTQGTSAIQTQKTMRTQGTREMQRKKRNPKTYSKERDESR